MPQLLAVLLLAALVVVIFLGMRGGWRRRERSGLIQDLPALPPGSDLPRAPGVAGTYVSTTLAGHPLERVVTLGLGTRSAVRVHVDAAGVLLARTGAREVFIPAAALSGVTTTDGMVGKFARPGSIVVLTWAADGTALDTGVHIRSDADRTLLLASLAALTPAPDSASDSGPAASQE